MGHKYDKDKRHYYLRRKKEIIDEIYHYIYSLTDPTFEKANPWEEWEAITKGNKIIIGPKEWGLGEV